MTPRRGLLGPLVLITLGVAFLLANIGILAPLSIVALFSLWPLVLVVIGIDIAIGRRWPIAALAADVLVIAAGLALVAAQPAPPGGFFFITDPSLGGGNASVSVPRSDAKTMTLRLSGGAGTYDLRGGGSDLVRAESDRADLRLSGATRLGDRMEVRIDQGPLSGFMFGAAHVQIHMANDVPTSLTLDAGAGAFLIDLSDTKVTDVRVNVGAASLHVVLPRATGDVPVTISAGASSVVIEIPDGVEARVTTSGGLTSTRYDNPRISGSETSGYATAKDRVTVRVTTGVSSVVIR